MSLHRDTLQPHCDAEIARMRRIAGGMNGQVYRVDLHDGQSLVVKHAEQDGQLDIEGRMLIYLRENSALSIPDVLHSDASLLIMTYIENSGSVGRQVEEDAAHQLAALHAISAGQYGLSFDTLIGSLHQPNTQNASWIDFFREQRLLHMAQSANTEGQLPTNIRSRIDKLAAQLEDYLFEPDQPSLIHGDMWGGNVLSYNERLAGFIDPAIYYAHAEIELAFSTLFNTFGDAFFQTYDTLRPIEAGFFEERRDLYNLYPLLVHVRLLGGGYVAQVDHILRRFGV